MAFTKIESTDYAEKGVISLADKPDMGADALKAKFDELSLDVIIPKFNAVVDGLNTLVGSVNGTVTTVENSDTKYPTSGAIVRYVTDMGGGDMTKAVYDTNNDGVVDNAEQLGGVGATSYQQKSDSTLATTAKTVVGGINELKTEVGKKTADYSTCTNYSSTTTYALNALVIYDSKLYKCTTAITTAEAWNSARWTQITDDLNGLVYNTSDSKFYAVRGADSVLKKLGSSSTTFVITKPSSAYGGHAIDVREKSKLTISASELSSSLRVCSVVALDTDPFTGNNDYGTLIQNVTTTGSDVEIDISSYNYITLRFYNSSLEVNKYYESFGKATITIE